jgi:hypothetical protein
VLEGGHIWKARLFACSLMLSLVGIFSVLSSSGSGLSVLV